jgi:hypothetical protein
MSLQQIGKNFVTRNTRNSDKILKNLTNKSVRKNIPILCRCGKIDSAGTKIWSEPDCTRTLNLICQSTCKMVCQAAPIPSEHSAIVNQNLNPSSGSPTAR